MPRASIRRRGARARAGGSSCTPRPPGLSQSMSCTWTPRAPQESALRSERGEAERGSEGVLVGHAVARRQGPWWLAGVDKDLCERGAVTAVDPRRERVDLLVPLDATGVRDAEAPRHGRQVCSQTGMAGLHPGLAEVDIVDHDDGEVGGRAGGDG